MTIKNFLNVFLSNLWNSDFWLSIQTKEFKAEIHIRNLNDKDENIWPENKISSKEFMKKSTQDYEISFDVEKNDKIIIIAEIY